MGNSSNDNLKKAKQIKNDEFYTRLSDIEDEIKNYKRHFNGKVVYCNCDDPDWSNFYTFFKRNFEHLKLKKLITTHYTKDPKTDPAYALEYDPKNSPENPEKKIPLAGNGDFRSPECINLLNQADIVCTNPPFSLFREYITQLINSKRLFLVIGNLNAITYKDIFTHFQNDELWLGCNQVKQFLNPQKQIEHFGNVGWFTNISNRKRDSTLILWKTYKKNKQEYPTYDNYKIIDVSKVSDIPTDYKGIMGVPITFLQKYNPDQFEIVGLANSARYIGQECYTIINGRKIYNRLLVKHKFPKPTGDSK